VHNKLPDFVQMLQSRKNSLDSDAAKTIYAQLQSAGAISSEFYATESENCQLQCKIHH